MINFSIAKKLSILALILGSVLACKNAHDKVISDSGNNLATIEKIPNDLPTVWPNSAYLTSGAVTTLPCNLETLQDCSTNFFRKVMIFYSDMNHTQIDAMRLSYWDETYSDVKEDNKIAWIKESLDISGGVWVEEYWGGQDAASTSWVTSRIVTNGNNSFNPCSAVECDQSSISKIVAWPQGRAIFLTNGKVKLLGNDISGFDTNLVNSLNIKFELHGTSSEQAAQPLFK